MPIVPIAPVARPFVPSIFTPDQHTLGTILAQQGALRGQAALQRGQGTANTFNTLSALFGRYQEEMQQRDNAARVEKLRRDEMAQQAAQQQQVLQERSAERAATLAGQQAQAQALEAQRVEQNARNQAADTVPGVVSSEQADALKPSGRIQILDGVPVLMRTPVQKQQAEATAAAQKSAEAALARQAGTDARLEAGQKELMRHNQVMENRPVSGSGGPGDVGLSPDAVEEAAHRVRLYGPSSIPTRFNEGDKKRILNRSAEINKAIGQTPAAAAMRSAVQKSDQTALTQITKQAASAEAFENKALQQADLVKELSGKVGRTDYPVINGAIVSGKAAVGNTPAHLLANALLTYTSEYAKIIEGSTGSAAGSSDAARRAAASLISTALSKGTLAATVDQMNREMGMTRSGYRTTIDDITGRMGGQPAAPAQATPAVTTPDLTGLAPGRGRRFSDGPFQGQTWTVDAQGTPKRVP